MSRAVVLMLALVAGCRVNIAPSTTAAAAEASAKGWEVRYNAAQALARRGSPKALEPPTVEILVEMLDEPQQLRNFRTKMNDGRELPDETNARVTVIGALKAVAELHRRQPELKFDPFRAPIEKLTHSDSPPVATEAKVTLLALKQ